MNKKRVAINMTAQLMAFGISMLLSFLLVPAIESMIPNAYGFTDVANKFVSAAQIVVSALNTMASRFITIRIHRDEKEEAGQYFSSVFFANVIMAAVFMIPALVVIVYLGRIFQIPEGASLPDIQLLFLFIFLNFTISIITSVFSVASYSRDRLELSSISTVLGEIVRLAVLAVCYLCFRPYLFYVGCASVASTVIQAAANVLFTRRLLPDMKLRLRDFRWKKVLDGLNTTIANIMISAAAMTTVSISGQVPSVITNLMGTIAGVFNPQMTIAYAKKDKKQLLDIIASADRIMIFIISIPIAFLTVFGKSFFELWVGGTQDSTELYILALLNVGTYFVSASIQVLYHVFLILKRVKLNSMVIILSGILTIISVFLILDTAPELGVYAIVGVSTIFNLLRNLFFTPLYASYCLKVKWYTFYGDILLGLVSIGAVCLVALPFELFVNIDSWIKLFGIGIVAGPLALLVNFFIVLRKTERSMVINVIKTRVFHHQSGQEGDKS